MTLDEIKTKIDEFAKHSFDSAAANRAYKLWPEMKPHIENLWSKAYHCAHISGDVQMAEGYFKDAQESLQAILDKYDDLASDPLP